MARGEPVPKHRVMCGDSTSEADIAQVLGQDQADLVWTDPPYGVAYVGKTADALTIENDRLDEAGLEALLVAALGAVHERTKPGGVWYVASPGGELFFTFGSVLKRLGVWRHTIIWVKDQFVLGRADYHYRREPLFYGWKEGAGHFFVDDRTQDTVWEIPRPRRSEEHPCMKPLELVARSIRNSSRRGDLVVDPFGGSGTTLLAAAQEGRRARLIELGPGYCDVIRRRWTGYARSAGFDPGPGALEDIAS